MLDPPWGREQQQSSKEEKVTNLCLLPESPASIAGLVQTMCVYISFKQARRYGVCLTCRLTGGACRVRTVATIQLAVTVGLGTVFGVGSAAQSGPGGQRWFGERIRMLLSAFRFSVP